MHYKNGRPANNGDKVLLIPMYGTPIVGILYDAVAGNDTCNGRLAVTSTNDPMPNLKDCLHVDDVKEFVAGNSLRIPDSTVNVVTDQVPTASQEAGPVTPALSPDPATTPVAPGCPDCGAVEGHTRGCSRY